MLMMTSAILLLCLQLICFMKVIVEGQQVQISQETQDIIRQNSLPARGLNIDRRRQDGWWVMYPFGEANYDAELLNQPNLDTQIDLDFYFPFYGFRFNYTFILPSGILAFSRPEWIQPPYTFPNPKWPEQRDPSFIAPFFADATYQYVGETLISHVWYRTVHSPRFVDDQPPFFPQLTNQESFPAWQNIPGRKRQPGYVEDSELLGNITRDIQKGIIGSSGFDAYYALIVTWERMAYGGSPKHLEVHQYEQVKQWQNTYQVILATDEIRSYVMFNYATINWTASNEAGALRGRGGRQGAIAGFNAGNGTGFTELPYSGQGDIYQLARFTPVETPGRWVYRVDEDIIPGGCTNKSTGIMHIAPTQFGMIGGLAANISGPCIRPGDNVVAVFDEYVVSCYRVNMGRARCIMPLFHKTGMLYTRMSIDGGLSYPFTGAVYIIHPTRTAPDVVLFKNGSSVRDNWNQPAATTLSLSWSALNLTWDPNAVARIDLMGYREDTEQSFFEKVGTIVEATPNTGSYTFDPRMVTLTMRDPTLRNIWKTFASGYVRVSIPGQPQQGVQYSGFTPFPWYFLPDYERELGSEWALDRCVKWYEYDGRLQNFIMDLKPCPCVLDQAELDFGRFMPYPVCGRLGDNSCPFNPGVLGCVFSMQPSWTGAQQLCCYDFQGWLMFSDDYEYNADWLKHYGPGTPRRGHAQGAYPYKMPPRIPSLSYYHNDVEPWFFCCKWAGRCEFYYWRRQSNGCQGYKPPAAGFAYGDPHFVTFDGVRYSFNGRGYFMLVMTDHPWNKLRVQIRMEQPDKTQWGVYPNATVITGVAVKENDSDVVQVLARSSFRWWRQHMDINVAGNNLYFDGPDMKWQRFRGLSLRSPHRNMDQSVIEIKLDSGAGVKVAEAHGTLQVTVVLPDNFNETLKSTQDAQFAITPDAFWKTYGLLGRYNADPTDDLSALNGQRIVVPNNVAHTIALEREIFEKFGMTWRIDGNNPFLGPVLFVGTAGPLYTPHLFSEVRFTPSFGVDYLDPNATYIFSLNEIRDACQDNYACTYDFINTGSREIALSTLRGEQQFFSAKSRGQKNWQSCGPLVLNQGAIKSPLGNNYLEGATVTFSCRPDYFLHGSQQRSCNNGTWSPGWWVWCRAREEEYALKWLTGVLVSLAVVGIATAILLTCYCYFVRPYMKRRQLFIPVNEPGVRPIYEPRNLPAPRRSSDDRLRRSFINLLDTSRPVANSVRDLPRLMDKKVSASLAGDYDAEPRALRRSSVQPSAMSRKASEQPSVWSRQSEQASNTLLHHDPLGTFHHFKETSA